MHFPFLAEPPYHSSLQFTLILFWSCSYPHFGFVFLTTVPCSSERVTNISQTQWVPGLVPMVTTLLDIKLYWISFATFCSFDYWLQTCSSKLLTCYRLLGCLESSSKLAWLLLLPQTLVIPLKLNIDLVICTNCVCIPVPFTTQNQCKRTKWR